MKRTIAFMMALVMMFSLCGCGKSNAVKETEKLIKAIGTVSDNSEAAIKNAENMYNLLTDNEKEKVANRIDLFKAREDFDSLWIDLLTSSKWRKVLSDETLSFEKTGTAQKNGYSATWEIADNTIVLNISGYRDYTMDLTYDNSDGIPKLINNEDLQYGTYTTEENYIELTEDLKKQMESQATELDWKKVSSEHLSNPSLAEEKYNGTIVKWTAEAYNLKSGYFDMAIETYKGLPYNAIRVNMTQEDIKNVYNFKEYTIIGELQLGAFNEIYHAFLAD